MSHFSGDLQKIPILRILIPFVSGLLFAEYHQFKVPEWFLLVILAAVLVLIATCFHTGEKLLKVFIILFFFTAGYSTNILARKPAPEFNTGQRVLVTARIISSPVLKDGQLRFEIESLSMAGENGFSFIKTIFPGYYTPDSLLNELRMGPLYHFIGKLYPIRNNGNPGEFDYAGYMARNGCYYRFYIDSCRLSACMTGRRFSLPGMALNIRGRIVTGWEGPRDDMGTLKAIVLGDRSDLTQDTRENYSRSGAMHILAVSGLHVGLIWMVLQRLFFFMILIPGGRWVRSFMVIMILWFYAFMAGLSPSVCRSVTMFSLFTFASGINRKGNSMNILLLTAFILLNVNPVRIRDVGFQLSYLAVTGIIMFQPLFSGKIRSGNKIIRWMIDLMMVSLSAQLATAPLSIFYFHQFPFYFILTNLLAIPLLSIIVSIFILGSPFFLLGILEQAFSKILLYLTHLMNELMDWISELPGAAIQGLDFDDSVLILSLIFILLLYLLMRYRKAIFFTLGMAILGILVFCNTMAGLEKYNSRQVVIGNFRGGSLITFTLGSTSYHFISAEDTASCLFITDYIKYAWQDKGFRTRIHFIDSLANLQNEIICLRRLERNAWLIGKEEIKLLFIKGNLPSGLVEFCKSLPVDMVVVSNICNAEKISELLAGSNIEVILDGSNRIPEDLMETLTSGYITITNKVGAYVKRY